MMWPIRAKQNGLLSHRFYDEGCLVVCWRQRFPVSDELNAKKEAHASDIPFTNER